MTTREAFLELLKSAYLWNLAGGAKNTRYVYLNRAEKGNFPTIDKMEEYLSRCQHFHVLQEKKWGIK